MATTNTVITMTPRLTVIELVVADMAASLAFYRRLGVEPSGGDNAADEPHVEAELGDGLRLAFDRVDVIRSIDPEWTPPSGGPGIALAFACDSPAEVDRIYRELVEAGYPGHREPWDAFWGMRYAVVRDPDGNNVDLFAPR
jgi:catechol 2,3-dioxygenase-like lactoylglutathione lyase family enzyme